MSKRFAWGADWWEVQQEMTWGAKRAVADVTRRFLNLDAATFDFKSGDITGGVKLDAALWDQGLVDETLLLKSTVQWSFGAVSPAVMAGIPARYAAEVLAWVNEVYPKADPLAAAQNGSASGSNSSAHS